jgi:hypothetical protein
VARACARLRLPAPACARLRLLEAVCPVWLGGVGTCSLSIATLHLHLSVPLDASSLPHATAGLPRLLPPPPADEPTSGLDARAAGVVMDAVRATVDTGRTVVCTIHQPSIDIFEVKARTSEAKSGEGGVVTAALLLGLPAAPPGLWPCCRRRCCCRRRRFAAGSSHRGASRACRSCTPPSPCLLALQAFDELLLLKPGGASIYFGPMGDSSERLIAYFQSIPGVHPCPERYNPANWWAAA